MQNDITGVLMAAGMGKRLLPYTASCPKALVKVGGVPLIHYGIGFLRDAGISNMVIVGGYHYADLVADVKGVWSTATLIENTDFEMQNGTSLLRVLENIEGNLLICDMDYLRTKAQAQIVGEVLPETTLYVSMGQTTDPDVMFIQVAADGHIEAMSKGLTQYNATSSGMFFLPAHRRNELILALQRAIEKKGAANARLEDGLLELAAAGIPFQAKDIGPRDWAEIDTPEDLALAERYLEANHDRITVL